jgi:hypothetical protein
MSARNGLQSLLFAEEAHQNFDIIPARDGYLQALKVLLRKKDKNKWYEHWSIRINNILSILNEVI